MILAWLEWVAIVGNIGGIVLTIYKNIWCWPIRIVTGIFLIAVNYQSGQVGQAFFWTFYVVLSAYGWLKWRKDEKTKI